MKTVAFAPGHISGFFNPVYNFGDISRTGSTGAGINIALGATSKVIVEPSSHQVFEITINKRRYNSRVINQAFRYLIGDTSVFVKVDCSLDLPVSQGFGMSAASALSATLGLAKLLGLSSNDAVRAAHFAEISNKTGLGDVVAISFGGVEIRKTAGLPPWGVIEHIPGCFEVVLCVVGKKLETKKVLSDPLKCKNISTVGSYCTKKLLENPSVESFFSLSRYFALKTGIADTRVLQAIKAVEDFGCASMCMLGNSVFAMGKTKNLVRILSSFGRVFVCRVDGLGARII